ncbi:MAG: 2'-5' RNA ligase family protein [Candidatus Hermodarchaeota archaeon]
MSKVHTTAVVIIPPEELWKVIQKIRMTYDRQFHRWMPHITLLYPFKPQSDFQELDSLFSFACKQIESFQINFHKFKFFNHGKQRYTVWLEPEPGNPIKVLQNALLQIVPDCNDVTLHQNGFTPHLSVGQIAGKNNLISVMDRFQANWVSLEFKVSSIYFIAREKQKSSAFKIKKEFYLK